MPASSVNTTGAAIEHKAHDIALSTKPDIPPAHIAVDIIEPTMIGMAKDDPIQPLQLPLQCAYTGNPIGNNVGLSYNSLTYDLDVLETVLQPSGCCAPFKPWPVVCSPINPDDLIYFKDGTWHGIVKDRLLSEISQAWHEADTSSDFTFDDKWELEKITFAPFEHPITITGGHTISLTTIEQLDKNENPFTRVKITETIPNTTLVGLLLQYKKPCQNDLKSSACSSPTTTMHSAMLQANHHMPLPTTPRPWPPFIESMIQCTLTTTYNTIDFIQVSYAIVLRLYRSARNMLCQPHEENFNQHDFFKPGPALLGALLGGAITYAPLHDVCKDTSPGICVFYIPFGMGVGAALALAINKMFELCHA